LRVHAPGCHAFAAAKTFRKHPNSNRGKGMPQCGYHPLVYFPENPLESRDNRETFGYTLQLDGIGGTQAQAESVFGSSLLLRKIFLFGVLDTPK
jgi:hypothetical protein